MTRSALTKPPSLTILASQTEGRAVLVIVSLSTPVSSNTDDFRRSLGGIGFLEL